MTKNKQRKQTESVHLRSLLAGALLGSLAGVLTGALAMLLLAPQLGEKTRTKTQKKGQKMRDHTFANFDDSVSQARLKAHQASVNFQKQIDDLQQHGHDVANEQKERWLSVLEASKTAVNGT